MRFAQLMFCLALLGVHTVSPAFEERDALSERLPPVSLQVRQRALPEDFSAIGKAGWEDGKAATTLLTRDLLLAVKAGRPDVVKSLLNDGALANAADEHGNRPLIAAVVAEQAEIVRLLIQRGARPNVKGPEGRFPLGIAAARGNLPIVRILLQGGADIDARSDQRDTALHEAIRFDHPDVARLILSFKPDPAQYDREGLHPLALAAARGRLVSLEALIDSQINPDLPDQKGLTALYWARRYQQALAEVMLLERGATREAWPLVLD